MGHSAGAQIAALIALDQRYLAAAGVASPQIAGLIGLSGPYDFLPINEGYLLDLFPEETREASQAINFASADAPPTLLIHGGDDDIVEEGNSERLAARLRSFGVAVSLKRYDGVGHGRVVVALAPPLDFIAATLDDCIAFIQQQ
jgi:acetyl esterase/lipase